MNIRTLLSLGICLLSTMGLACRTRIKTSSYIVHRNFRTALGVSSGGTLMWVAEDGGVSPFKVHFFSGSSPCKNHQNDLLGYPDQPASCKIAKNNDGVFSYAIGNPNTNFGEPPLTSANPPFVHILHVDGCHMPCPPESAKIPTSLNNPDIVYIQCKGDTASAEPETLTVYAGQIIEWSQVGLKADVTWEAAGLELDSVCIEGPVIGTTNGKGVTTCTVKADAPIKTIRYSVSLNPNSCKNPGTSKLTVIAP